MGLALVATKIDAIWQKGKRKSNCGLDWPLCSAVGQHRVSRMNDQQLAIRAIGEAQSILEEYLLPRPQNNDRVLDRLVEVLERPDVMAAVSRLQRNGGEPFE